MFGKLLHRMVIILNWIVVILIRSFFVSTSLAPVFLVLGIGELERYCKHKGTNDEIEIYSFIIYFSICIVQFILCRVMIALMQTKSTTPIPIDNLNRKDNEILSFLFIFILPLIGNISSLFDKQPIATTTCFIILIFAIADIGAYHFNPIIRLWGYHIYSVKIGNKDSILIARSRRILRSMPEREIKVVNISIGVYIHHWKVMKE